MKPSSCAAEKERKKSSRKSCSETSCSGSRTSSSALKRYAILVRRFLHDTAYAKERVCFHYLLTGFFPNLTLLFSGCCFLITLTLSLTPAKGAPAAPSFLLFHTATEFFCLSLVLLLVLTLLFRLMVSGAQVTTVKTPASNEERRANSGGLFRHQRRRKQRNESPAAVNNGGDTLSSPQANKAPQTLTSTLHPFVVRSKNDVTAMTDALVRTTYKLLLSIAYLTPLPLYTSGKELEEERNSTRPVKLPGCCAPAPQDLMIRSRQYRATALSAVAAATILLPRIFSSCWPCLALVCALWTWRTLQLKRQRRR